MFVFIFVGLCKCLYLWVCAFACIAVLDSKFSFSGFCRRFCIVNTRRGFCLELGNFPRRVELMGGCISAMPRRLWSSRLRLPQVQFPDPVKIQRYEYPSLVYSYPPSPYDAGVLVTDDKKRLERKYSVKGSPSQCSLYFSFVNTC